MMIETRWAIRAKTTKKIFPKPFLSREQAEEFREHRADPEHWEVVKQEITYSDWEIG